MQHQISQPYPGSQAGIARGSRSGILLSLPNARDDRYPRHWAMRIVRAVASIWWLPLAALLGYAGTTNALVAADAGTGPLVQSTLQSTLQAIAAGFGLDGALPTVEAQPWLLALAVLPTLALLAAGVLALRWASADRVREARTLLMREVSPSEQANSTWMRNAFAPALDWRVRSLLRRRALTGILLLMAGLVFGVLVALVLAGAHLSLATLLTAL